MKTEHQKTKVFIDGQIEDIDNEMVEIIKELNRLGFKTSGCCIGHENESSWIIMQETNEARIISLMNALKGTEYLMAKTLYLKSGIVYVQWYLTTPDVEYDRRINAVNQWVEKLSQRKSIKESFLPYLNNECNFG
jgi:hypothetical protein